MHNICQKQQLIHIWFLQKKTHFNCVVNFFKLFCSWNCTFNMNTVFGYFSCQTNIRWRHPVLYANGGMTSLRPILSISDLIIKNLFTMTTSPLCKRPGSICSFSLSKSPHWKVISLYNIDPENNIRIKVKEPYDLHPQVLLEWYKIYSRCNIDFVILVMVVSLVLFLLHP